MHPRSKDRPTQAQLVFPLLETLHEAGGKAKAVDVAEALADRFDLPREVREEVSYDVRGRKSKVWDRHVRYAREKAKQMGYVQSEQYGIWGLTDEGAEGIGIAVPRFRVRVLVDEGGTAYQAEIELDVILPTVHTIRRGDARNLSWIPNDSVHLIVTSPPYHDLKAYDGGGEAQLGDIQDYREFLMNLLPVWEECFRVLVPGGKMFINVGDVLRSRKRHGRHHVLPLSSHVRVQCFDVGFDCINYPIWRKIGNITHEQGGAGAFLGKPNQPNGKIQLEIEHILGFIKPGPYRKPTKEQIRASFIPNEEYQRIFRQIWNDVPGASTRSGHPAPFPIEIPRRLIRGYSYIGDTVLDVFAGSGNTMHAAMELGRNSISNEISQTYVSNMIAKGEHIAQRLVTAA